MQQSNKVATGIVSAVGAYVLWGLLPMYWKMVSSVPANEILAHRVVWSFLFMVGVVILSNRQEQFLSELRQVIAEPKKMVSVAAGALLISLNWITYIWAVNDNRIIETSLGYYINPIFSVLLGILVLKETLSLWQRVAVLLAAIGVLSLAFHFGTLPWVALLLAITFGIYGLCKKTVNVSAITGITLETVLITPFAIIYLLYLYYQTGSSSLMSSPSTMAFLMGTGVVTATPLLLFSNGANRLSLSLLGFIQYVSPTIALLLGVFLYHEPFSTMHFIAFGCIWLALGVFSLARTQPFLWMEARFRGVVKNSV